MNLPPVTGMLPLDDEADLTLDELSRSCRCSAAWLVTLVHEGVLEPRGDRPEAWRFGAAALHRARVATRLMQDLEVNAAGAALALELLDDIRVLRQQLRFGSASP